MQSLNRFKAIIVCPFGWQDYAQKDYIFLRTAQRYRLIFCFCLCLYYVDKRIYDYNNYGTYFNYV